MLDLLLFITIAGGGAVALAIMFVAFELVLFMVSKIAARKEATK